MPLLRVNGTELYYEDSGGPGPAAVFSHGLLWSGRMFEAQVSRLRAHRRCITYDHRGQGRSAAADEPVVSIETCYADAVALIEALGVGPCDFVGLSMGGFVAMRLAARRPDLIRKLVLLETSAEPEPPENVGKYKLLAFIAEHFGLGPVAGRVMKIMFGKSFLADEARRGEQVRWRGELLANRRDIVKAVRGVIERSAILPELSAIRAPTLVIVGEEDTATTPAKAEAIVAAIAGAKLVRIPRAGHTSSVEQPVLVSAAIDLFLAV